MKLKQSKMKRCERCLLCRPCCARRCNKLICRNKFPSEMGQELWSDFACVQLGIDISIRETYSPSPLQYHTSQPNLYTVLGSVLASLIHDAMFIALLATRRTVERSATSSAPYLLGYLHT